jgi:hypothetical protein
MISVNQDFPGEVCYLGGRDSHQLCSGHHLRSCCSQRVHVSSFSVHRFSFASHSADERKPLQMVFPNGGGRFHYPRRNEAKKSKVSANASLVLFLSILLGLCRILATTGPATLDRNRVFSRGREVP